MIDGITFDAIIILLKNPVLVGLNADVTR